MRGIRRDWANLGDGPAGLIADCVLAHEVADYIRFRAVCRPWRRCSPNPHAYGVLEDRRWITLLDRRDMLHKEEEEPPNRLRRFLNFSTGQCIQVDIPEPEHRRRHLVLPSTTEGLLVLLHQTTDVVRLLNPLTHQAADLPPITGMDSPSSAGLADDRTVVLLCFGGNGGTLLALAKPGDNHWVLVKTHAELMPTMSFAGRFYGVASDAIMMVDTAAMPPRLMVAAKLAKRYRPMLDNVHLVDNGGKLMLVHREIRRRTTRGRGSSAGTSDGELPPSTTKYKVYRVDLDKGKTVLTSPGGLRGRAVFVGLYRALSVSPQVFPSISADTVYPGLNCSERCGIGTYHMRDGSIEPSNASTWSDLVHP